MIKRFLLCVFGCSLLFLSSCSKEARELKKQIAEGYTAQQYDSHIDAISLSRYADAEIAENQYFVKKLSETVQSSFDSQLELFDKNELGFFASYKYMFYRLFLSKQKNHDLWHVKTNRYFSNLEIQQEAYNVFLNYNDRVKLLRSSFLKEGNSQPFVASMPTLELPEQNIYLDAFSRHSLNNIFIEFGADVAAWLLILLILGILSLFGITWTKGYSLVAFFVSLIISVGCSLVNDSHIKNSIREQAIKITTVNYDEILNSLNDNTIHFYEAYLK